MENFSINESTLKDAICKDDVGFFTQHREKFDIDYRLPNEDNDTLLLYAMSDPESNIYKHLIESGADLTAQNNRGENILHSAIYSGRIERVKEVLRKVDLNKGDIDGTTPLLLAIGLEYADIANLLIFEGANISLADNQGNYPIHLASFYGLFPVVQNLLLNGGNLFIKTNKGNLPLALAVNQGHNKVIKILYAQMYGEKS